jgi:5-methyltetrahydropteroyltriglutamate--homocysteine methyltransferase
MKQSTNRILTTHVGSLPRPQRLLEMMSARFANKDGRGVQDEIYRDEIRKAVSDCVRKQAEVGIDIVSDGEMSKTGFFSYANERLTGLTPRPGTKFEPFPSEIAAFPEYYKAYFEEAMLGGTVLKFVPMACTGRITYRGERALQADLDNLKAAIKGLPHEDVFVPATAPPHGIFKNAYYEDDEEYAFALADAMSIEYKAIVDAGFNVQVDDPMLADIFSYSADNDVAKRKTAMLYVEAINHALKGIPPEKVRFHTFYV